MMVRTLASEMTEYGSCLIFEVTELNTHKKIRHNREVMADYQRVLIT
ncbi:hypothetical protein [Photobacterium kishitanii]|nr:hypothetical protein [Photobacterium kishitanii]